MKILVIISSIGLAYIITRSYIFSPIRERISKCSEFFGTLMSCNQCMSFWTSILMNAILFTSIGEAIALTFAASGIAFLIDEILNILNKTF